MADFGNSGKCAASVSAGKSGQELGANSSG